MSDYTYNDVQISNSDGDVIFLGVTINKLQVVRASKSMEHPLESGVTITDHRVITPVEVIAAMVFINRGGSNTDYDVLEALFKSGDFVTVQTRFDTFSNMIVEAIPHEEDTENVDGAVVMVKFKQVLTVTSKYEPKPKNKEQADTVNNTAAKPVQLGSAGFPLKSYF